MPTTVPASLQEIRQSLLHECAGAGDLSSPSAYLLERDEGTTAQYRVTASTAAVDLTVVAPHFTSRSLLIRWLRVNGRYLPIPDAAGLFEALDEPTRDQLTALGISGCVPLVCDRTLLAWVAFVGPPLPHPYPDWADMSRARVCARRLHDGIVAWRARAREESAARSNRLSTAGAVAASVAHEVRNPLAIIRSNVQLVLDNCAPDDEGRRHLGKVLDQVDRAGRTLAGMLTIERPNQMERRACDLRPVVQEAVDFCRPYARSRGVTLHVNGTRADIEGDAFELHQVFVNVCLNACQASASGGRVDVSIEVLAADATVRIEDAGSGIAPADLPKIFEPFFTTKANGGGLGLTICRDIVGRHDGSIEIARSDRHGTTVVVTLPCRRADESNPGR